nr:topoisomerase DNA-binding C4 zinc finger domain-containing protein [Desulfobulbaceae bacterium]
MADTLIIVDSPAKKLFFDGYYSGEAEVYVSMTPVAQPRHKGNGSGLGGVDFSFSVANGAQEVVAKLAEYQEKNILIALDADPRSEYLGWILSSYVNQISKGKNTVKRLTLSGLSEEDVKRALDFVSVVDEQCGLNFYTRNLFEAFLAKHLVRLVGTNRGPGNFTLQYNSLTPMFLLADREAEIQTFRPSLKWQVKAELSLNGRFFQARLEEAYDMTTDGFFAEEKQALWINDLIDDDPFVVDTIKRSPLVIQPPSPYMLTELLHDALVLYEASPKDTLGCLRKLFHGVSCGGKTTGVISSFSTLENADASGWLKKLKDEVVLLSGPDALGDGVVEPVTGMIFPLMPHLTAEAIAGLSESEATIYELIRCRALASQMKAAVGERLNIEISAGPEAFFSTQFSSVSEKGFLAVYQGRYDKSLLLAESPFAGIKEEQVLNRIKLIADQKGGVPAEHYTIDTLFADLADFSIIADPANILLIQGLADAGYIVITKEGYLKVGENIKKVTSILSKAFPYMQGINLSAYIEQTIVEASTGRKGLEFALKQFDQALTLQGRVLIKAKLPTTLKPRLRRSSTIIKQVSEEQVEPTAQEEVVPISDTVGSTENHEEQLVAKVETPSAAPVKADQVAAEDRVSELIEGQPAEPEVLDSPEEEAVVMDDQQASSAEDVTEKLTEEVMAEAMEEPSFLADSGDEWPEELEKAFEAALHETDTDAGTVDPDAEVAASVPGPPNEKIIATDLTQICQVCGKAMLLKEDRFGQFWSCSGFPACRHTEAFDKNAQTIYCPICREGALVAKRTPSGKSFYVCQDSDCEFMSWAKPHYVSCNLCDSQYLVEKKSSSGKIALRCPKAGCDYSQPLGGEEAVIGEEPKPKKRIVRVRRKAGSAGVSSGAGSGGKKKVRIVRRKKT